MSLTVSEQIAREANLRANPPKAPLDAASIELVETAYKAKSAGVKTPRAELVKSLEAMPNQERAAALMGLAMARPVKLG